MTHDQLIQVTIKEMEDNRNNSIYSYRAAALFLLSQEREACAKIAVHLADEYESGIGKNSAGDACREIATAIRDRNDLTRMS